ncbi:MAG: undecaprenyldiphospho-muramoylpentapeptide beta-N-acetylglucosaminyltransferase [Gammaproteobacteria bacterium]|nr:MAG: undecaprenyldiphospho-muramoylpentapeptide beta-N-acetylglucosaminyltransferase [Gammaproteobacteria bacterium]
MSAVRNTDERPVLIMAGGTGGHIFPGIAVARALRAREVPVVWLGSAGGLETRLVPQAGIALETLAISGVRGKGFMALFGAPLKILRALIAAWKLLGTVRPRSVLSLGGFAAGPGGIAAFLRGVPLIVHEQNSIPGVTNRVLSIFAKKRLCGFMDALPRSEWIGNPVRDEIAALPPPAERFAARMGAVRLLVLGGSQGARALNERVPQALALLPAATRPQVRHQCGAKLADGARAAYAQAGVEASVEPFIEDMAAAYAWADVVICRAGALTLAELAAAGVGAVLVPFPFAVDDHQTRNAQSALAAHAAVLLPESEANAEHIAQLLGELIGDRARLAAMAQAARALAKPHAAVDIAQLCVEVAA